MEFGYVAAVGATPPLPIKEELPAPVEKSFVEYFDDLKTKGKTIVPCPHGHGIYQLKVEGAHWYHTPEIIFASNENCPMPFRNPLFGGRAFHVHGGRVIAWYPKWLGYAYKNIGDYEVRLREARMIVRIILSGRKLYTLRCGDHISSLDDDNHRERAYIQNYERYGSALFER